MPIRKKGEPLNKYVSRCIPVREGEHPELPQDAIVASCYSMGRKYWKPKKKSKHKGKKPNQVIGGIR